MTRAEKRRQERAAEKNGDLPPFRIRAIKIQPMLEFFDGKKMSNQRLGPELAMFEADAQFDTILKFLREKGLKPIEAEE